MILLIIGVGMLNFLLPAPLNSIMFLLIPRIKLNANDPSIHPLNSIMFLLIPECIYACKRSYKYTLNSIMFLLIPSISLVPQAICVAYL